MAVIAAGAFLSLPAAAAVFTFTDLSPAGASSSYASGVHGGQQVGYASFGGNDYAALWTGTAASFVNLNPAGASYSTAFGAGDGQQVGYANFGGNDHAALWTGTAASFVDLNPPGARSEAYKARDGQQVGYANFGGNDHAALWTGTAASFLDLGPAGADESQAEGTSGGQQVGYASFGGIVHAGLWTGTAGSFVDLNPAIADTSEAAGVYGLLQVGRASIGGVDHAALWFGTADSFIDLNTILGAGYQGSIATGISSDGTTTYISGYAYDLDGGNHGIVWTTTDTFTELGGSQEDSETTGTPEPGQVASSLVTLLGVGGFVLRQHLRRKGVNGSVRHSATFLLSKALGKSRSKGSTTTWPNGLAGGCSRNR